MSDEKKTTCRKCGKEITYKTKPPSTCHICKNKKKTRRQYPKKKNTKGELYLFAVLDNILRGRTYINHGYYSMLPSPKGAPMQLDRYYPELRLAFEYDGPQHETYSPFIHKSYENFQYMKECDKVKEELCKKLGITLIRVHYKHRITDESLKLDIKKANKELYKKLFE